MPRSCLLLRPFRPWRSPAMAGCLWWTAGAPLRANRLLPRNTLPLPALYFPQALEEPGNGRVLVVDGGGSLRCALLGDMLAEKGYKNGWSVSAWCGVQGRCSVTWRRVCRRSRGAGEQPGHGVGVGKGEGLGDSLAAKGAKEAGKQAQLLGTGAEGRAGWCGLRRSGVVHRQAKVRCSEQHAVSALRASAVLPWGFRHQRTP